jgi:hypothetical protein
MEPLDENELNQLLRKWEAPEAPASLTERVFPRQRPWFWWLLNGSIRIPVPAAFAAAALVAALWIHYSRPVERPRASEPGSVSLADFRPVRQLEPVLVGGGQK